MKSIAISGTVGLLLAIGLQSSPAQAAARTFVSALTGSDAGDCSVATTPCKTFQYAHDNTSAAGEITVLDPGGYGAVKITKSISIINDGVGEAGMLVSAGVGGITISAGSADSISLRGLTIKGIGSGGGTGIIFNTGKALLVENCVIRTLDGPGNGILFQPNAAASLTVTNTLIADNTTNGIMVAPLLSGPAVIKVTLSRVEFYNNGFAGLNLFGNNGTNGNIEANVADSVAANNGGSGGGAGFIAQTAANRTGVFLMLFRSVAAHNTNGVVIFGPTFGYVGGSEIFNNTNAVLAVGGGTLRSFGDNNVFGNFGGETPVSVIPKW